MEDDALRIVLKKIRERKDALVSEVGTGSCKDFGTYQNVCGVIHGLGLAERELYDLLHAMENKE